VGQDGGRAPRPRKSPVILGPAAGWQGTMPIRTASRRCWPMRGLRGSGPVPKGSACLGDALRLGAGPGEWAAARTRRLIPASLPTGRAPQREKERNSDDLVSERNYGGGSGGAAGGRGRGRRAARGGAREGRGGRGGGGG